MHQRNQEHTAATAAGLGRRLAWFGVLWLAGVASVGFVSLLIKWALK